jgi:putative transcriptional regulator
LNAVLESRILVGDDALEWNDAKAAENWRRHGVTFQQGAKALHDPFAIEWIDDRVDYGEERINLLGMCEGVVLYITYTERGGRQDMSKTTTIAKMRPDGSIAEVLADGTERLLADTQMWPMTPEEIEEAARVDPDARPYTPAELAAVKRVPRVKTLRRALGLTQEEFAARYRIPLGTLRDWEQGRSEPDHPARAYLTVIAHDPEGVHHALKSKTHRASDSAD